MRFFRLETGRRRYYRPEEQPQDPSPVMYAGVWDDLVKALTASNSESPNPLPPGTGCC
jgi:hypothetical protein